MKNNAENWFKWLQKDICLDLENLENESKLKIGINPGKFEFTDWIRTEGGGGTMAILREGLIFEKAGVNFSSVHGEFSKEFRAKIPGANDDANFWAAGISVIIHPRSPLVPIIHMNTRMLITSKTWFGGGIDLTPVYPIKQDTDFFHDSLKKVCNSFDKNYYALFKKACDDYFYIKHRNEMRGIGGIFYDNLNSGDLNNDFEFTKAVGVCFKDIYPTIVRKHYNKSWGEVETKEQLNKRAKYVEFNLIYDRGTEFGLKTGGNIDAIFTSLPPLAAWR